MGLPEQLSLLLDVVQQGSFSKVAAMKNIDNSQLSKQIKKLETELGVQLLNRSTRALALTAAGEEIVEQAKVLLSTINNIHDIAHSYQDQPRGVLRITSSLLLGQLHIQPAISAFISRYPDVKIELTLEDKRTDIIAEKFDLAIRMGKMNDSNLIAKKIANTHFTLVASERFLARHTPPTTPDELMRLPAIIYANRDVTLDSVLMSDTPHGHRLKSYKMTGPIKVNDVQTLLNLVQDGVGYAVIDLFNLSAPLSTLGLQPLLPQYTLSTKGKGIYAVYPHRKHTKLVQEFMAFLQDHIGDPPYWYGYIDKLEH